MKSRAAIAVAAGKPLEIDEIEVSGPKAGEVLIQVDQVKMQKVLFLIILPVKKVFGPIF